MTGIGINGLGRIGKLIFLQLLENNENVVAVNIPDFDINNLIQNVFEMLEFSASKKNIKLILDHDGNLPINVNADNEKIQQVLTNLIQNSIKYGKENGTTEIVIQDLTATKVIVRVTDNGLGIEEK